MVDSQLIFDRCKPSVGYMKNCAAKLPLVEMTMPESVDARLQAFVRFNNRTTSSNIDEMHCDDFFDWETYTAAHDKIVNLRTGRPGLTNITVARASESAADFDWEKYAADNAF